MDRLEEYNICAEYQLPKNRIASSVLPIMPPTVYREAPTWNHRFRFVQDLNETPASHCGLSTPASLLLLIRLSSSSTKPLGNLYASGQVI